MIFLFFSIFYYNINIGGSNVYFSNAKSSYYNFSPFFRWKHYSGYINIKDINGDKGVNFFYFSGDSIFKHYKIRMGDIRPNVQLPFSSYPRMRGVKLSKNRYLSLYLGKLINRHYSLFPEFSENRYFLLFNINPEGIPAFTPSFSLSMEDNPPTSTKTGRLSGDFLFNPSEYWEIDNKISFGMNRNGANQPFIGINTRYRFKKQDFLLLGNAIFISPHYTTPYRNTYRNAREEVYLLLHYRYPSNFGIEEGFHFTNSSLGRGINWMGGISYNSVITYIPSIKYSGGIEIGGQPFSATLTTSNSIEASGNIKFLYYNISYQKRGKRSNKRIGFSISPSPNYRVMFRLMNIDSILKHYYSFYISPYNFFSMSTSFYFTKTRIDGLMLNLNIFLPRNLYMKIGGAYYKGYLNISSSLNISGEIEKFGFSTLEGEAFIDENGDKRHNPGESPWKGINIILDERDTTKTDTQGRYRFRFISQGPHTVRVDFRNIPANYGEWGWIKKFTANMWGKIHISFPLAPLGTITGKVFYDENRNGEWDEGEKGVPNVIVFVKGAPALSITDEMGIYRLCNFPPGVYLIGVRNLPRGYTLNPPNLLIYAYLKPGVKKAEMSFGIIKKKRPIRKKIFK